MIFFGCFFYKSQAIEKLVIELCPIADNYIVANKQFEDINAPPVYVI